MVYRRLTTNFSPHSREQPKHINKQKQASAGFDRELLTQQDLLIPTH